MPKLLHGWIDTTLGELCDPKTGLQTGPFGSQLHASDYTETGIPVVMPKDIVNSRISVEDIARIPEVIAESLSRHRLIEGDIVFGRRGDIGRCALIHADEAGWLCGTGCLRARFEPGTARPDYVVLYLQTPEAIGWLETNAVGQTMLNLNTAILSELPIPLPPLAEQRKIAAILSAWDAAITLTRQLIAALQRRKQALMQLLLTGAVRFPGFEDEWTDTQVKELGKISSGGTPDTTNPAYWDGDILWCTPTEITALLTKYIATTGRRITAEGLKNSSAVLLEPNSILICTRATVGQMGINLVPMATNQGFKNLTPSEAHNTEFLYYLLSLNKHELVRLANGSTFLELSKGDFEEMRFTIPDKNEQTRIADVLDACDQAIEMYYSYAEMLNIQKRGLMQQLLTGALRVQVEEP